MISFAPILEHAPGFALVLARLTGLFIFAPLLSSAVVPRQFKVMLSLAMALVLYPTIDHAWSVPRSIDFYELGPLLASELLIGLSIGVLASIPLMTAQLAGIIMGQQMGLGLASVFNPAVDFEGDSLGQILFFIAMASYLAAGGLEVVYGTLLTTFRTVPLGGFSAMHTPLDLLLDITSSGFAVALRLSLPVLLILFLETIAAGFIMKTVPALNIMNVGFPIRILLGLFMVISSLVILLEVLMHEIGADLDAVKDWARSLA